MDSLRHHLVCPARDRHWQLDPSADEQCDRILREMGIDPGTVVAVPARPREEADTWSGTRRFFAG